MDLASGLSQEEQATEMIKAISSRIESLSKTKNSDACDLVNILTVAVLRITEKNPELFLMAVAENFTEAEVLALVFPDRAAEIAALAMHRAGLVALLVPEKIAEICKILAPTEERVSRIIGTILNNPKVIGWHRLADTEEFKKYFPDAAKRFGRSAKITKKD